MEYRVTEEPLQQYIKNFIQISPSRRSFHNDGPIALGTSLGLVRKENQDCAAVIRADFGDDRSFTVAAVCDGLGGMRRGADAAVLALSVFLSRLIRTTRQPPIERLMKAASDANWAVHDQLHGDGGTTLSAVFIEDNRRVFGINAGDSRLYSIRYPNKVEQISRDDNLAALAVNRNRLSPHSNRLIQFVGMGQDIEFHLVPLPAPASDTAYLLTSDGAHSIDPETFEPVVSSAVPGIDVVRRLLSLSEWCGGKDNATVIYIPSLARPSEQSLSNGVINITLHSTSRTMEILIPSRNSPLDLERQPVATYQKAIVTPSKGPSKEPAAPTKRTASRSTSKKKKKKAKRGHVDDASLPLEEVPSPRLEVNYPTKR